MLWGFFFRFSRMQPGQLAKMDNVGKFVIYVEIPADSMDQNAFVVVAKIVKFEWDDGKLFLDVDDFVCSRDQHFPSSIAEGKWRKPSKRPKGAKPIWLDASVSMLACIFDSLTPQKPYPKLLGDKLSKSWR